MTARILVVDDLEPNVRLLRAKLEAEYFDVLTANSGFEAIEVARTDQPDLILLDVMMPGMDGFEVCQRLKGDARTRHIPVVMVTALDQQEDRVSGLRAGADDFLTKPIDDIALLARVRSLLRLKTVMDELRSREAQGRRTGAIPEDEDPEREEGGRVLVIDDNPYQSERIQTRLQDDYRVAVVADPKQGADAAKAGTDVMIVNLASRGFDGMRLCARVRSDEATRQTPILAIVDPDDKDRIVKALDLGVNDVVPRPVEAQELRARVRTQMRHKRYADVLRGRLDETLESAVTDQLTGLHNRRYIQGRLARLTARAHARGEALSVMLCDIDHFKRVNDQWGHDGGDDVLREFAKRLTAHLRAVDLACRWGGEEFLVVLPEAPVNAAAQAAERFREAVAAAPFRAHYAGCDIDVTASIGVSEATGDDTPESLVKRADEALYAAKQSGRNCVKVKLGVARKVA